jgi:transposase
MYYMGVDYHKQYSHLTILDKGGEMLRSGIVTNDQEDIRRFIHGFKNVRAVVEASRTSYVIADMLEWMGIDIRIANPMQVKAIAQAKIKTDKRDSRVLADLLRADLIPEVYMRSRVNREAQRILRQRVFFVRMRTQVKNRIAWILGMQMPDILTGMDNVKGLYSQRGLQFLETVRLGEADRKIMDELLESYNHLTERIQVSDEYVRELYASMKEAKLVRTIPGFGPFYSVLVPVEIGEISRFAKVEKLHAYTGVIPSLHSSGGKVYHGKIIKAGNKWLRWAAVEAVWPAIKADVRLKVFYQNRAWRKGSNVAKVATARKLLTIVYRVLKEERPYDIH